MQVSGVNGYWWTVAFLVLFGLSFVAGLIEGALRIRTWFKGITAKTERLEAKARDSERKREELETKLREAEQERDELLTENKELIAEAEASKQQSETSEQPPARFKPTVPDHFDGPAVVRLGPGASLKGFGFFGNRVYGKQFLSASEGASIEDATISGNLFAMPDKQWWRDEIERAERKIHKRKAPAKR